MSDTHDAFPAVRHDPQVERQLLGAMLWDRKAEHYAEVGQILGKGGAFYHPKHADIYARLMKRAAAGKEIDPARFAAEDFAIEDLNRIGGVAYLATCLEASAWAEQSVRAARTLSFLARARALAELGAMCGQGSRQATIDNLNDWIDRAQARLADIVAGGEESSLLNWEQVMQLTVDELQEIQRRAGDPNQMVGLPTAWSDMNRLLNNLQEGQLVVVAGRPGTGKTVWGLNLAQFCAVAVKRWALIFALEMRSVECGMRLLSAGSRVPLDRLRGGGLDREDWTKMAKYLKLAQGARLKVDDNPTMGLIDIEQGIRQHLAEEKELDLVVIDYLQLMTTHGRGANRQEAIAALTRGLKLLAKKYHIIIVLICQLNRNSETRQDKRPQLSDLRESGGIEQDADVVILLHRDDYYDKESPRAGEADFIVAKSRQGPTDTITVAAQLHLSRFVDMAIV